MNILISCSGKQVDLIKWFKDSVRGDGSVFVCDCNKFSPSFAVADKFFIAPEIGSDSYKDWFLKLCIDNEVDLVLSLYESDLIKLESIRALLRNEGCELVGAEEGMIEKITNKHLASGILSDIGIKYPTTYLLSDLPSKPFSEKYVIKPFFGRGSRGVVLLNDYQEVLDYKKSSGSPSDTTIVQEYLEGEQYCIDVVNDLQGNYVNTLTRRRIKMGVEETEVAITEYNKAIENIGYKLSILLRHQGSIDVDIIENHDNYYVIDINVRFGGSYAFSHNAGANIPAAIISWANNRKPLSEHLNHEFGVVGAKYNSVMRVF